MKIEHKLQIDAIKGERIYFKEYGELTLLCDGHIGVYLNKSELKIDKSKLIELHNSKNLSLDPNILSKDRTNAKTTLIARKLERIGKGFAIQIKSIENDEFCFVDEKYLKMFFGYNNLQIKSKSEPVLVYKYGVPYGIILPVRIFEAD